MSVVKRSVMTLYSNSLDIHSHRVRIVLAEKSVSVDVISIDPDAPPQDLLELNPYDTVPTLVDRDLVLYQSNIIMEYLDERFPHPPLLPVYPVARAQYRLMMHRVEQDWYTLASRIEANDKTDSPKATRELAELLLGLIPVFADQDYFLSDEFSLVDCAIAPLLWRLPSYGITLPKQAKSISQYCDRVFSRDAFQASLTEVERELRDGR